MLLTKDCQVSPNAIQKMFEVSAIIKTFPVKYNAKSLYGGQRTEGLKMKN